MNIVVIGSGGQLGTDCCRLFAGGHTTVGVDFPEIDISRQASVDGFLDQFFRHRLSIFFLNPQRDRRNGFQLGRDILTNQIVSPGRTHNKDSLPVH